MKGFKLCGCGSLRRVLHFKQRNRIGRSRTLSYVDPADNPALTRKERLVYSRALKIELKFQILVNSAYARLPCAMRDGALSTDNIGEEEDNPWNVANRPCAV